MPTALAKLTAHGLIDALGLPPASRVDQRIPKKLLAENGAPTAADRKLIQDGIEEATWVAAIKPGTAAVPEYRDEQRTYLELAVVAVNHRLIDADAAKHRRLAELIHRAIPYPLVLVLEGKDNVALSLAHIRWAQNEADKTVLDGELLQTVFESPEPEVAQNNRQVFLSALSLSQQPLTDLCTLYQSWQDVLTAWQSVAVAGRFELSPSREHAIARREALRHCRELDAQIACLRTAARKEKQIARQVEINLKINGLLAKRERCIACV